VCSNTNELGEGLWRVEVASGETRVLLPVQEGTTDTAPVWSPDGTEIAFYRSAPDANPVVYTVTLDGEPLTPITDGSAATIFPVYSPDGNWLVYTTINGDKQELTALERTTGTFTPYPDLLGFATSWATAGEVLADTGLTQGPKNTGIAIAPEVMAISYKLGSDTAPVQIVEFSDYQCPFCQKWYNETMVELRRYIEDGTVQLIFVDYPLSFHPEADEAAQAARCVGDLGGNEAYWQMHDKIFEGLSAWGGQQDPVPVLTELASSIGVNGNAVEQCIRNNQYLEHVQMGINEGNRLGVSGTPTFFINGNRLVGAQPWSAFEPYLQQAGGE
jgi:protein-disulfide isomerase